MTVTYNADLDLGHISDGNVQVDFQFQRGPLGEFGQKNGITNEQVIELLIKRVNARRKAQGVEGKNLAHVSSNGGQLPLWDT